MAAVLDSLASYVQTMLMEMATEEVHMLLGVSEEIDKMGAKLGDLKNFLADADRRNITDLSVQTWVRDLRSTMYDATDILYLCQLKAMERGPNRDMGCFNPFLFCMRNPLHAHDIGSRIKNLNQRLDGIKERSAALNFVNLSSYEDRSRKVASSHPFSRETSAELDESNLVGEKIEEDTRNLVEMLTKNEETHRERNKIMVFAIVGVGGIGKTTLAQKIFNNDIIQQEFTKKIWLSVNQDFNDVDLLRRAIAGAGGDHQAAGNTKTSL
uniref:Rx N-terminal domain-containing protein n=1 Tax=Arundo donax TaxID=35708 RepID=A0A0A9F871_ARUDO